MKKYILSFLIVLSLLGGFSFTYADNVGDKRSFYVESKYEANSQNQVSASLVKAPALLYFYADDTWWNNLTDSQKQTLNSVMDKMGTEFNNNIYPKLTSTFGHEATPGVNKDSRITILLTPMGKGYEGYIRNVDSYEKTMNPFSNERLMIYMNTDILSSDYAVPILAHEFMHLITENQKELKYGTPEETWLNEARSEYAVSYLGYNDVPNSYLDNRIASFANNSSVSLTNWKENSANYGLVNMFASYLVDQYGINVLVDSLHVPETGIASINEALNNEGSSDNFNTVFKNWSVAVYLNDCSFGAKYCYKDKNLVDMHVVPLSNFLPYSGTSTLYLSQILSNYSAQWQRFAGGKGDVQLSFKNGYTNIFSVPYVIKNNSGAATVGELKLDSNGEAVLKISNMGQDISSVAIIPVVMSSNAITNSTFYYSLSAAVSSGTSGTSNANINLPFAIDKPLNQMNREELLSVLLKLIIYLVSQGKLKF